MNRFNSNCAAQRGYNCILTQKQMKKNEEVVCCAGPTGEWVPEVSGGLDLGQVLNSPGLERLIL